MINGRPTQAPLNREEQATAFEALKRQYTAEETKIPQFPVQGIKDLKISETEQLKALQVIGENTKKQNELTLRNLTYGGGELAAQGLSRVEQTSARQVSSPQLNASNDIVRGVEKMIRMYSNSNNLNFSFRRS